MKRDRSSDDHFSGARAALRHKTGDELYDGVEAGGGVKREPGNAGMFSGLSSELLAAATAAAGALDEMAMGSKAVRAKRTSRPTPKAAGTDAVCMRSRKRARAGAC